MAKAQETEAEKHARETAEKEAASAKALADFEAEQVAAAEKAKAEAEKEAATLANASRKTRWAALVANFKKEHPLAYEARKHTGEFDLEKIPADFV